MATAIKYIGRRPTYREGCYGSGILFSQGETVLIEDDTLAQRLLRHPDQYIPGDDEATRRVDKPVEKAHDDEETSQQARDAVSSMNKAALEDFARTHFRVDLDRRKSEAALRSQVIGLIDQFGVE